MYRNLKRFREERSLSERALSISGSQVLLRLLGYSDPQITDASYPQSSMLQLPFADESFDCVCSDQVLEHVEGSPQEAIDESFRVLKPGGLAVHTTVFVHPMHGWPSDFWRFTPEALRLLCKPHAEILDADGWGSPHAWIWYAMGLRMKPIPEACWHPFHWLATHNRSDWPIVTWVIARKHVL